MSQYPELTAYAAKQGATERDFTADGYNPRPVMHYCAKHKRERLAIEFENGQSWRYTDEIKPKYGRRTGYERHWYYLDRAITRAQQTGQPLILVNGEGGTTATYHAHGLPTTCVTGGEKGELSAPLLNELKTKCPEGVIWIVFDCDPGGRKAAAALAQQLTLAGYTVRAIDLQLPNAGGDIADFCKANPVNTLPALAALPDLPKAPEKRRYEPVILQDTETPPELIQEIAAALNAPPPKASGFSRANVTCPFSENHNHADKNESASFNWKTGAIYCHAAGCGSHGHKAVAERKGIDWRRHDPKPERRTRAPRQAAPKTERQPETAATTRPERPPAIKIVQRDESPLWSDAVNGLPDSWRCAALNIFDPAEVNFLLALIRGIKAGRIDPARLTVEIAGEIELSESQLDRIFTRLTTRGLFIVYDGKIQRTHKTSVEEDSTNTYRGFVRLFRLQTMNELNRALIREIEPECKTLHLASNRVLPSLRHFDVELSSADVKPVEQAIDALRTDDDHHAESSYRADLARWEREFKDLTCTPVRVVPTDELRSELLRMYVEPGNRYSREELARFLGCSVNSLADIRKKAGLQAIPQWEDEPLEPVTSAENLNLQVRQAQKKQDGKVIHFNGATTYKGSIKNPVFVAELQDAQRRGEVLTMCLRVHSRYVEARATDQTDNTPPPDAENETNEPEAAQETAERESVPVMWRSFTGRKIRVALRRMGFQVNRFGDVIDSTDDELMLDEPALPDVLRWIAARVPVQMMQFSANQNRQFVSKCDARKPA